jgi:hypothetical protein
MWYSSSCGVSTDQCDRSSLKTYNPANTTTSLAASLTILIATLTTAEQSTYTALYEGRVFSEKANHRSKLYNGLLDCGMCIPPDIPCQSTITLYPCPVYRVGRTTELQTTLSSTYCIPACPSCIRFCNDSCTYRLAAPRPSNKRLAMKHMSQIPLPRPYPSLDRKSSLIGLWTLISLGCSMERDLLSTVYRFGE